MYKKQDAYILTWFDENSIFSASEEEEENMDEGDTHEKCILNQLIDYVYTKPGKKKWKLE